MGWKTQWKLAYHTGVLPVGTRGATHLCRVHVLRTCLPVVWISCTIGTAYVLSYTKPCFAARRHVDGPPACCRIGQCFTLREIHDIWDQYPLPAPCLQGGMRASRRQRVPLLAGTGQADAARRETHGVQSWQRRSRTFPSSTISSARRRDPTLPVAQRTDSIAHSKRRSLTHSPFVDNLTRVGLSGCLQRSVSRATSFPSRPWTRQRCNAQQTTTVRTNIMPAPPPDTLQVHRTSARRRPHTPEAHVSAPIDLQTTNPLHARR